MRYKVCYKDTRVKTYNENTLYFLGLYKESSDSKHRAEIEDYLENMNEPTIINNGDGTVTLEFDPIPEDIATWMVTSKTTFFNVVRLSGGGRGHPESRYRKRRPTKNLVRETFTYPIDDWKVRGSRNNITIPNTLDDRANRRLSIQELTSGAITRDVSYLNNFVIGCKSGDMKEVMFNDGGWYKQFYIGLIYFDVDNIPSLFKMDKYDIVIEY